MRFILQKVKTCKFFFTRLKETEECSSSLFHDVYYYHSIRSVCVEGTAWKVFIILSIWEWEFWLGAGYSAIH